MIHLERVSRWYGQVLGLNDVSCDILPGLTALLGPNGAGKSTMLKLITGQLRPSTGRITVLNEAPFANPKVFRQLGYCPEIENSYDEMTGREFVHLLGAMAGLTGPNLKKRVEQSIEEVGMTENADRKVGGYSKGMRQRIKLAQAIIHDPQVIVLDEPLNGLDPVARHHLQDLLRQLAARGKCILVSSHILHEVEQLTHNLLLINRGRLLAQGDIYQIRSLIDRHPHRIDITATDGRALARRLVDLPYVLSIRFVDEGGHRLEIETRAPEWFYNQFPTLVLQEGFQIQSFGSPDNNLEAVFKYLVGTEST
jgi:ABC-2 type transport system ATP-binding protein